MGHRGRSAVSVPGVPSHHLELGMATWSPGTVMLCLSPMYHLTI